MQEAPIASLQALTANLNRDPKKSKPFNLEDFMLFRDHELEQRKKEVLSPQTAAAMLELRHKDMLPSILLMAWKEALASVKENTKVPDPVALHSDDQSVWVVAPKIEGKNIRGGLVAVDGKSYGTIRMRDINRPLMVYDLIIPERRGTGWLEAELLLVKVES